MSPVKQPIVKVGMRHEMMTNRLLDSHAGYFYIPSGLNDYEDKE